MQSQPNHIEILAEKNTVLTSVKKVAEKYCIPVTSGRGHASLDPRRKLFQRYQESGKEELIIIVVSDFDPAGECIAESFCRSMRDDFGVSKIVPVKAALTHTQIQSLSLVSDGLTPKTKDRQRKAFIEKYGEDQLCYELEAIEPKTLENILADTIDSVIDIEAFNAEIDKEREDSLMIQATKNSLKGTLESLLSEME